MVTTDSNYNPICLSMSTIVCSLRATMPLRIEKGHLRLVHKSRVQYRTWAVSSLVVTTSTGQCVSFQLLLQALPLGHTVHGKCVHTTVQTFYPIDQILLRQMFFGILHEIQLLPERMSKISDSGVKLIDCSRTAHETNAGVDQIGGQTFFCFLLIVLFFLAYPSFYHTII